MSKKNKTIDETKRIFEQIHNNKPVDFSNLTFNGFDLDDYRKKYKLDKTDTIKIYFNSAINTTFDGSKKEINFSFVEFISTDKIAGFSFQDSLFKGNVKFDASTFNGCDVDFSGCKFENCNFEFIYCNKIKNMYFNDALKNNSNFTFFGISDITEDINFINFNYTNESTINDGSIIFDNCNFSNDKIVFEQTNLLSKNDFLLFINCTFNANKLEFLKSNIDYLVFYECSFDSRVNIKDCNTKNYIIQGCIIKNIFRILKSSEYLNSNYRFRIKREYKEHYDSDFFTTFCFLNSSFNGCFYTNEYFTKETILKQKKLFIDYSLNYNEEGRFVIYNTTYLEKSKQANNLSEIFNINNQPIEQDLTYFLSKRYKNYYRVQEKWLTIKAIKQFFLETKTKDNKKIKYIFLNKGTMYLKNILQLIANFIVFLLEFILLDLFCGRYATKPLKFLFWILVIITAFSSMIFIMFNINNINLSFAYPNEIPPFLLCWIISFTNFFQIDVLRNYNDLPQCILFVSEKLIGIIVLGLFTVSYTRKIIR